MIHWIIVRVIIVIKSGFDYKTMDDKSFYKVWEPMKNACERILKDNCTIEMAFGTHFWHSKVKRSRGGEKLYNELKRLIKDHLSVYVRSDIVASSNDNFLQTFNTACNNHEASMNKIKVIFRIADQRRVPSSKLVNSYSLGMMIFRDEVIKYPDVRDRLMNKLLDMIPRGQKREETEGLALRETCQKLINLRFDSCSVFEEDFLEEFLQKSREFYEKAIYKILDAFNVSHSVEYTEHEITEVKERAKFYLDQFTADKLVSMLQTMKWVYKHGIIVQA